MTFGANLIITGGDTVCRSVIKESDTQTHATKEGRTEARCIGP